MEIKADNLGSTSLFEKTGKELGVYRLKRFVTIGSSVAEIGNDQDYGFSTVEFESVYDSKHGEEVVGGRSGVSKDKTGLVSDWLVEIKHDFAIDEVTKATLSLAQKRNVGEDVLGQIRIV